MNLLLLLLTAAVIAAADPPPVPDPIGLGERLALIDHLREVYGQRPAADATLDQLRSAYAAAWARSNRPSTETIPDDPNEAAAALDRSRRLRVLIHQRHQVEADPALDEAGLQALLRRLDAERAVHDAAEIEALAAADRAHGVPPSPRQGRPPPAPRPSPAEADAAGSAAKVAKAAGGPAAKPLTFTARGVTGSLLVSDGPLSVLLVAFGTDPTGAFQGMPQAMLAALHGAPAIHRAVLLLGHGDGTTIAGEPIEAHLKANRQFYETLGGTAAQQPVECMVFASCSSGHPDQMLAMRDGLGYWPTWRVAAGSRSYANGLVVLAALQVVARRPAQPAWRAIYRMSGAQRSDVACVGEVGEGGQRTEPDFFTLVRSADGSWKVEEQR